jgi:hypothetical protein
MDARRRQQVRAGICFGIPALALALCTVLGLGAQSQAEAKAGSHGHAAMAPAPNRPVHQIVRMQDPIGFDVVVAENTVQTSHPAGAAVAATPHVPLHTEHSAEHNRGPPAGELV